jgi:uncharacterized protein YukE
MAYGNLGIGDVTIGYSFSGAKNYLDELNYMAIETTKNKLSEEIKMVEDALVKGWQGYAQEAFIIKMYRAIEETKNALDQIKISLEKQFAIIEQNMVEQDKKIVE